MPLQMPGQYPLGSCLLLFLLSPLDLASPMRGGNMQCFLFCIKMHFSKGSLGLKAAMHGPQQHIPDSWHHLRMQQEVLFNAPKQSRATTYFTK
jgi:hypothetical protein